jgi:digeranylgeranylglycerophospholipid reductase
MRYDAVVIGAGPAGSMAAVEIARAGFSVALLEKHSQPGTPLCCGEAVSKGALDRLMSLKPDLISCTIDEIKVVSPGGKAITVKHPGAGYILNRPQFDLELARQAVAAGAELLTETIGLQLSGETAFESLAIDNRKDGPGTIDARIFIATDGVESKVARLAGIPNLINVRETESLLQYRLKNIEVDPALIEIYLGRRIAPSSYLWIFPKSDREANVGLGVSTRLTQKFPPEQLLNDFIGSRFPGAIEAGKFCGLAPRYQGERIFRLKNLLVAGDAARADDSISGAGILYALLSGRYAGMAAAAFLRGDIRQEAELDQLYPKKFLDEKGEELALYRKLRNIYDRLTDDDFDEIIVALIEFFAARDSVAGLKPGQILAGLIKTRPKLLKYVRHLW